MATKNNQLDMQIIIRPVGNDISFGYMDKLTDVVTNLTHRIHQKEPRGPYLEVSFQVMNSAHSQNNHCAHKFKIKDLKDNILMIQCEKCFQIYHLPYEWEGFA